MKRSCLITASLVLLMTSSLLLAQEQMIVMPIAAKKANEKKTADDVFENFTMLFSSIKGVKAVSYEKELSPKDAAKCKDDLKCMLRVAKEAEAAYYLLSKISSDEIMLYLMSGAGKKLGTENVEYDKDADEEDIAAKMLASTKKLVDKHVGGGDSGSSSSSSSARSSRGSSSKTYTYSEVKEEIKRGMDFYRKGDLSGAEEAFLRASSEMNCKCSQNEDAKKHYENIVNIKKGLSAADDSVSSQDYGKAERILKTILDLDAQIREAGYKLMSFKKDNVERVVYRKPSGDDVAAVDSIHNQFKRKIEDVRKWRLEQQAAVDKWINDRIKERESVLAEKEKKLQEFVNMQKEAEKALKEKVQGLKYQWEKDDSSLEQEIVNLESQITMIEQREKGVVKAANKGRENAQKQEYEALDKKNDEMRKKIQAEKDAYYSKQKEWEDAEGKKVTARIADIEKKKKEKEEQIKENDKKMQELNDEFDKAERAKAGELEAVRMRNEDEDRKYAVEVERDYQKKFDQLNSQLAKYDTEESKKQAEISKFDREIEEYMAKSAEKMGKFQEDVEKERAAVDGKYNTDKSQAQQKAEKEYQAKLAELTAKRQALETAVAKHGDETEQMRVKKEDELTKAQEAKIQETEKRLAKIEEDLAKIDQDFEGKVSQIQNALAKMTDAEESEKSAKENELRQKNEAALQKSAVYDEKMDKEKIASAEVQARIEDEYAAKISKIDDDIANEKNKLIEATENLKANWGEIVNKEIEKLMAQESSLMSDLDQKKARKAEIDAKYEAKKAEQVNKIDDQIGAIENKYAEKLAKVEDQVQREGEAERARLQAELDKEAQAWSSKEEQFAKELAKLGQEESAIAQQFDAQVDKLNQTLSDIDDKYAKLMQPYSTDSIIEKMNQEIAELDNKKVEEVNKLQEMLDAIRSAKISETQSFQDKKAETKNKAELAKMEREHQANMRKIEMDEGALDRKLKFTEDSANRSIQTKRSTYERQIAQNKEKLDKFESEKAKETIDINKKIKAIGGDKAKALAAHQKKVNEAMRTQKAEAAKHDKEMKAGASDINKKVAALLGSVKQRQAAVLAEKSAELKALKEAKATTVQKIDEEAKAEKGKVAAEVAEADKKIKDIRKEIKGWEKRSNKVDPAKANEMRKPFQDKIAALEAQKKALVAEKTQKIKGIGDAVKQKIADIAKEKATVLGETKGFDALLKAEMKKIAEKYAAQKNTLRADEKKLAAEKTEKAAALTKERATLTKGKDALEKGFAKNIKKEVAALSAERAKEFKKLNGELSAVSKALAQHEESKDMLLAQAVEAIDMAYDAKSTELDMKNVAENKRLQAENDKFTKAKKAEKAQAEKAYKTFLAEKERFRKSIDKSVVDAQKERDQKIADRKKQREKEYQKWEQEKANRKKAFEARTAGTRQKIADLTKEVEKLSNDIAVINADWAKKLDDSKVKNQAEGQKKEKAWSERQQKETDLYEEGKRKITEKYEQMEIKEKNEREKQKQTMMAQRDKLLAEKEKRKEKRQGVLAKEKEVWEKKQSKSKDDEQKLRDEIERSKSKREEDASKDKEDARKKKAAIDTEYQKRLDKIGEEELKVIQSRYKEAYKVESKRDLELTATTKNIEAKLAEVLAKNGLNKLNENDLSAARDAFVQALYLNRNDKTAKEGLNSINSKAKAIYWEAFGIKESDKTKARKMLQQLLKSLLATDEYFLRSRALLEEIK